MSVILMLAFTWWGILGFAAVVSAVSCVLAEIEDNYGRKKYYLLLGLIGMMLMMVGSKVQRLEEEAVQNFLYSWSALSREWPDSTADTTRMWRYVDFARSQIGDVPNYPHFLTEYRLVRQKSVRRVGSEKRALRENIHRWEKAKTVTARVFEVDVVLTGNAVEGTSGLHYARARFWVARDNNQIIKFYFDEI